MSPQGQARAAPRADERLDDARREAYRIAAALECPSDVAEEAGRLIEQARGARLTQGRSMDALAAACVYMACRRTRVAVLEDDVFAAALVPASEIQAAYKAVLHGLHIVVPVLNCYEYVATITRRLEVAPEVGARAWDLLGPVCCTTFTAGKNPIGWAAAAIVIAARSLGVRLSVHKVSRAASVSPSTTQARIEDLEGLEV